MVTIEHARALPHALKYFVVRDVSFVRFQLKTDTSINPLINLAGD